VKENLFSDKNVIKFCLIGFLILFFIIIYMEKTNVIENSNISELSLDNLNEYVRVSGFVKSQTLSRENLFLEICDSLNFKNNSCIKVSLFGMKAKLKYRRKYEVLGKINYYNSNLSIIARSLRNVD